MSAPLVPTIYATTVPGVMTALLKGAASGGNQIVKLAVGHSGVGVEIIESELVANGGVLIWNPSSPGP